MANTTHLGMLELVEGQKSAATAVNSALLRLDATVQMWAVDVAPSTTPPVSGVEEGHSYIVPASATGDWANQDGDIATWQSGWVFITPRQGWRCWDVKTNSNWHYVGGQWVQSQAARIAELTDNTSGIPGLSLADLSGSDYSTEYESINDNIATLHAHINAIMDALITSGVMAGDALTAAKVNESVGVAEAVVKVLNP